MGARADEGGAMEIIKKLFTKAVTGNDVKAPTIMEQYLKKADVVNFKEVCVSQPWVAQ